MTVTEMVGPTVQRIVTALPSFLFALGILVVGYVIAKIGAGLFAFAMALQQIGFGETIVVWAFVLLFGAICLALALAFGLGSREAAARAVARALGEGVGSGAKPGSA